MMILGWFGEISRFAMLPASCKLPALGSKWFRIRFPLSLSRRSSQITLLSFGTQKLRCSEPVPTSGRQDTAPECSLS